MKYISCACYLNCPFNLPCFNRLCFTTYTIHVVTRKLSTQNTMLC